MAVLLDQHFTNAEGTGILTCLACCAFTGSPNCSKAWNWLFFVNVIIFNTAPNLENICQKQYSFTHLFLPIQFKLKWNLTYLMKNIQGYWIVHVVNNYSKYWTLSWSHCTLTNSGPTNGSVWCLHSRHCLKNCLGPLKKNRTEERLS